MPIFHKEYALKQVAIIKYIALKVYYEERTKEFFL